MKINLPDEISVFTLKSLFEEVHGVIEEREEIIFDLTSLKELDAAGFQFLVSVQKTRDRMDKPCRFVFPKFMEENLRCYGADKVFEMEVADIE